MADFTQNVYPQSLFFLVLVARRSASQLWRIVYIWTQRTSPWLRTTKDVNKTLIKVKFKQEKNVAIWAAKIFTKSTSKFSSSIKNMSITCYQYSDSKGCQQQRWVYSAKTNKNWPPRPRRAVATVWISNWWSIIHKDLGRKCAFFGTLCGWFIFLVLVSAWTNLLDVWHLTKVAEATAGQTADDLNNNDSLVLKDRCQTFRQVGIFTSFVLKDFRDL